MRRSHRLAAAFSLTTALFLLAAARPASAQLDLPRPSPTAKLTQRLGLTDVTIEYSSPGVKNRKIWGGLLPYDKFWRTGANATTKLTFSRDVTVAGKPVPAGSYGVGTIPGKTTWTVILNRSTDLGADGGKLKQEDDVARFQVTPKAIPLRERLAFVFSDFSDEGGNLDMEWEKVRVSIPIKVGTTAQAMANIKDTLDGTWRTFNGAARYMLETTKDYDAGLKYVDQSLSLKEEWFNSWTKAQLLAAKGDFKDATTWAEKANTLGTPQGPGFFFADEVRKSLGEWKKKK
jgi:hypothetical protein